MAVTVAVKDALHAKGEAPIFACRAWVNFNGMGVPVIRGEGNVSSVVRLAPGYYRINFKTPMPDTNYSATGFADAIGNKLAVWGNAQGSGWRVDSFEVCTGADGGLAYTTDADFININFFR